MESILFQYRKRYGLHAISSSSRSSRILLSFNTASGMDCMQYHRHELFLAEQRFQYRKRYGLHAIRTCAASDCTVCVSIPQAVWIACNERRGFCHLVDGLFQYRKRYGLHAIKSGKHRCKLHSSFQYRKRYGLHAIYPTRREWGVSRVLCKSLFSMSYHSVP